MSQAPLIDRALKKARTGRALAQAIGWHESQVSHWKHGRETIPPEAVAALAVYLDENPIDALAASHGGTWARIARAMKEKVSAGFDSLRLLAKPRRISVSGR